MVNPFDRNFFKFLLGFIIILISSFALLYIVNVYRLQIDGKGEGKASALQSDK
jgi:hypothetical protein